MDSQERLIRNAARGALSGLAATVPMTGAMMAIQRLLPPEDRQSQEPRQITEELLRRCGLDQSLTEQQTSIAALAAHFGYGAAVGASYSLFGSRLRAAPTGRGPLYGLMLWTASYAGWLPALGILPAPHRRPLGRNLLLIASHLVWGLGIEFTSGPRSVARSSRADRKILQRHRKPRPALPKAAREGI